MRARLDQTLLEGLRQLLAGFGQDLAGLRIRHVERQHLLLGPLAHCGRPVLIPQIDGGVASEHANRLDTRRAERLEALRRDLVTFAAERLSLPLLRVRNLLRQQRVQHLTPKGALVPLLGEVELLGGIAEPQDVAVGAIAQSPQQRRGRELLALVDVHVHDVVDVDRELHPRAPERDDPSAVQQLSVRVRALLEHHTGRAVQLRHDDPLRAVDHERTEGRQHRELTEVDFLLDDVLRPLEVALQHLVDDEAQRRLEGRRVRHVALDALPDGVLRIAEGELHELERVVAVHVGNREHFLEHALERNVRAITAVLGPQERVERARLDVQEMRHRHPRLQLRKRNRGQPVTHLYSSRGTRDPVGAGPAARRSGAALGLAMQAGLCRNLFPYRLS